MARLVFTQLMIGIFTSSLLRITLADVIATHPGENITLPCNHANYSKISWYRLNSKEVKLIITAKKGKLDSHYSPSSSVTEAQFDVNEDSSLVIIGVKETDLGFYYCGGQKKTHVQLGKPIALRFTDNTTQESVTSSSCPDHYQVINIILTCVCFISFLIHIICICLFRIQVQGKSVSSCKWCRDPNTTYSAEKEMNLHYANLTYTRQPPDRNTPDLDRVMYAGIRHLPA